MSHGTSSGVMLASQTLAFTETRRACFHDIHGFHGIHDIHGIHGIHEIHGIHDSHDSHGIHGITDKKQIRRR